jgi:hypothetical protein
MRQPVPLPGSSTYGALDLGHCEHTVEINERGFLRESFCLRLREIMEGPLPRGRRGTRLKMPYASHTLVAA